MWYWEGASSLSEIAFHGVSKPQNCKFALVLEQQIVFNVIEIIPMTDKAIDNIYGVKPWSSF